jgi:hypothetical protein
LSVYSNGTTRFAYGLRSDFNKSSKSQLFQLQNPIREGSPISTSNISLFKKKELLAHTKRVKEMHMIFSVKREKNQQDANNF